MAIDAATVGVPQHFEKGTSNPYCLYCVQLYPFAKDSPFCSDKCANSFYAAARQQSARRQLRSRCLVILGDSKAAEYAFDCGCSDFGRPEKSLGKGLGLQHPRA